MRKKRLSAEERKLEELMTPLQRRLAELRREELAAACPSCGCTARKRCWLTLGDDESVGVCAFPLVGHKTCSACLTPERRLADPRAWRAKHDPLFAGFASVDR